jgi:hypothetical protein
VLVPRLRRLLIAGEFPGNTINLLFFAHGSKCSADLFCRSEAFCCQ